MLLGEFYLTLVVEKESLLHIFFLTHLTECRRQIGNTPESYSGGLNFKSHY